MKICAIICEYNPFHNGHLYQINKAKRLSGADALLCLMSGNFVQRGEAAIFEKHIRAKHAILAGADVVIELPTVFATSNAELFAKGAIHLLSSIPSVSTLCFGCETADKTQILKAASLLNDEPKEVSLQLKALMATGASYAKARAEAWKELIPTTLLSSPNNILGLEYTKAILEKRAKIDILPVKRIGGRYSEQTLKENYSSASAIRAAIDKGETVVYNLPEYVNEDLDKKTKSELDLLEKYAILSSVADEIASVSDCTEGLENALKKAAESSRPLVEELTSARYTSSRIRRIALQNLLKIDKNLIKESLLSPLYFRILAAKKERNEVLTALSESTFPLLARAHDDNALNGVARNCYEKDIYAEKVYSLLSGNHNIIKNIFI